MTVTELIEVLQDFEHRGHGSMFVHIDALAGHLTPVHCVSPGFANDINMCLVLNDTAIYTDGIHVERWHQPLAPEVRGVCPAL